jgi:hypothetical protein
VDNVRIAVTPGQPASAIVTVTNHGNQAMNAIVLTVGLGEGWAGPPSRIGPIAPGTSAETSLAIQVPAGFPPCEHLGGIEIEPVSASGASLGPVTSADLVIAVGDASHIQAALEPPDIVGGGKSRFELALGNRAREPMNVRIEGEAAADHLSIRFDEAETLLPPGQTVRVQGHIKSKRPLLGPRRRFPFFVRVQGRTTPLVVDGSFTQRPIMSGTFLKVLGILTAIALWGSLLVVGLGKLGAHHESTAQKNADAAAASSVASGNASGGANGNGGGNGTGGGGGGGGAGGGGGGAGGPGGGSGGAPDVKVGGKVKSPDPSGVTVALEPTSLVDEGAQGATFEQDARPHAVELGMHYGHQTVSMQQSDAEPKSTTTDQDGVWAFAGVRAPGFYLLTFSKDGYGTRKFVVSAPDDGSPVKLDEEMQPGDGSLNGMVHGPDGAPLGSVDLSISNGTNTLTTATPTTGAVGSWGVQGLSTPGTYLITASRRGYGTETQLVDLGAGGSQSGININMVAGVGSITGVVMDGSAPGKGAKDVSVTASNGQFTRTVSTETVGQPGAFSIPQLPLPGKYTITVTGDGFLTSTQDVTLDPFVLPNAVLQITLMPSTGSVTGFVVGPDITPGEPLPNPLPPDTGLDTVGITIANETVKLKTTSATGTDGKFVQNNVPPGRYVVTFEKFGYVTASAAIEVTAGQTTQVPETGDPATTGRMRLAPVPPESIDLTGTVTVTVRDQRDGSLLPNAENVTVTYTNDSHPTPVQPDQPVQAGVAVFSRVDPGLATFTAKATHFATQSVQVKVIPKVQVDTTIVMQRNAIVQGTVRDSKGNPIISTDLKVIATPEGAGTGGTPVDACPDPANTTTCGIEKDPNGVPTGNYIFNGTLDQGTWGLTASASNYVTNNPPITVNVTPAKTFQQDISLQQLGQLQVDVLTPNATDGALVHVSGATVTVTGGPTTVPSQNTGNTDPVTFKGLLPGIYTLQATATGLTQKPVSGVQIFVNLDGTATTSLLMTRDSPAKAVLRGRVVYDNNGTPAPITNALVAVTGVNYPPNNTPPPPFNAIRSTTAPVAVGPDGTFTIDTTGFDFAIGDVHVFPNPGLPPTSFTDQTFVNHTIYGPVAPDPPIDFPVQPKAGTVTGTITYNPVFANDAKTAVVGTITSPAGTGISITVSSTGVIGLTDPRVTSGGVNAIKPGTYSVTFSRDLFEPAFPTAFPTGSFTVPPGGTVDLSAVLTKHGSVSVNVSCTDVQNFFTSFVPPAARVTLTRGQFTASQVVSAVGNPLTLIATFDNLVAAGGPYAVDVHSAGCTEATSQVNVLPGQVAPAPFSAVKLGSISGTVRSQINATSTSTVAVQGATVSTTDPVSQTTFTTTTDANGHYFLGGLIGPDPTTDLDGLNAGAYTVSATSAGEEPSTVTVDATISNALFGQDDVTADITMTAKPATVDGFVKEATSTGALGAPIVGATVTATSATAGRIVNAVTDSTGAYSFTGLEPVLWTFTYTAQSHSSVVINLTLTPGATVHNDEGLISRLNTISGVVNSQFGSDTPAPEGGVNVHILATNNGNTTDESVTSANTTGAYSQGGLNDGTYAVTFSKTGFRDVTDNVSVANGQNFVLNETIIAIQSKATLTIVSAVGPAPIADTSVTIQPQSGGRGTQQTVQTGANGQAVFNQVPPSAYNVTITAVAGHLTTLDTTTLTVSPGGADVNSTFTVQEAQLHGVISKQDTAAAATPFSSYPVQIYNGTSTTGTANFSPITDATGTYSVFVPGRTNGYTFKFTNGANYNQQNVSKPALTGDDVSTDFTFVKFGSLSATVGSTTPAPTGSHYDYTIALDSGTAVAGTTRSFTNLTSGSHTIHYTRTLVTGPSGSPPTTTTGTADTHDSTVNLDPGQAGTDTFNFP